MLHITANIEDEPGSRRRITGLTQDITEGREARERIQQLAHFDTLTGLPNRFLFRQRAVDVQIGCSIGIALLSDNNPDIQSLMRASDTAMYAAKEAGRNTCPFCNDSF